MVATLGLIVLLTAVLAVSVASGRTGRVPALLFAAILLPFATRGILSGIGYVGPGSLSAADIQFLRAAQWLGSGLPLGTEDARLTLYPTSFAGLATVHSVTGISLETLLEWGWMIAIPLAVVGSFLFVSELTGNRSVGALSTLATVGNPWIVSQPIYDGLNLALLPLWAYAIVRRQRNRSVRSILLALVMLTAMISSHFFSALFLVLTGFAIGMSVELFDSREQTSIRDRLRAALRAGLAASVIPAAAVAAWLTYIAGRYLADSADLIKAFISSLAIGGIAPGASLNGVLSPSQLVILGSAALAFGLIAVVAVSSWAISRSRTMGVAVVLALFAVPLVGWAIVTPLAFVGGIDLKEWKVRPLAAAFLLCAPVVGMALHEIGRKWPPILRSPALFIGCAAILTNSVTLWLSYGSPGPAVFSARAPATVVEDIGITPQQYQLLGNFVRASVSQDRYLAADWHQLTWMVGAGGLRKVPDYQTALFADSGRTLVLSSQFDGIAVDRNLLDVPSVYLSVPAEAQAMAALETADLDRIFDSGTQVLYLAPSSRR